MKTIWKFELEIKDKQKIKMPVGAEILTVQVQNGIAVLWAKVDPSQEQEDRIFMIHGTGHMIKNSENYKYINTFQLFNGSIIGHVFEYL